MGVGKVENYIKIKIIQQLPQNVSINLSKVGTYIFFIFFFIFHKWESRKLILIFNNFQLSLKINILT